MALRDSTRTVGGSPAPSSIPEFRAMAEALPAMVAFTSAGGDLAYVNTLWIEYTGLTLEDIASDRAQIVHPDDRERTTVATRRSFERGEPLEIEYRVRRHDGAYRWHLWRMTPMRDADGELLGWLGVTADIEDRRGAEDAMRASERRLRFFMELSELLSSSLDIDTLLRTLATRIVPDLADVAVIDMLDREGVRRLETATSFEGEEGIIDQLRMRSWQLPDEPGVTLLDTLLAARPLFLRVIDEAWLEAAVHPPEQLEPAKRLRPASGMILPLQRGERIMGALTLVMTQSGRRFDELDFASARDLARRASVAIDNAELYREVQRAADELRAANAAKDEFLGLVSHEVRTPLTVILGNAQVLLRTLPVRSPGHAEALSDIRAEAERLNRIITNLLLLARLEGQPQLELEPVLIAPVVERVVEEHRRRRPEREVCVAHAAVATPCVANEIYVEQILANLLTNAEKYSPAGRPIEVRTDVDGGRQRVRVLDRGAGFDPDEAGLLFDPFYRSRASGVATPGIGIGLTVCKRLVEVQGGEIYAAPRDGGGSEFCFSLPLCDTTPDD